MYKYRNPAGIAAPQSAYSHGVEVTTGYRWLHISGQVGVAPDGTLPEDYAAQLDNVWFNLRTILTEGRMSPANIVKLTGFLVEPADVALFRTVRDANLEGARPASTLVFVSRLVDPRMLVEIEAVAAMPA